MLSIKWRKVAKLHLAELKTSSSKDDTYLDEYIGGSDADYVELANDESIIKDYYVATVKKPSYGEAHFAVTNKRLIMYIWSEETIKVNNVNIIDIVSTSVYKTKDLFAIINDEEMLFSQVKKNAIRVHQ